MNQTKDGFVAPRTRGPGRADGMRSFSEFAGMFAFLILVHGLAPAPRACGGEGIAAGPADCFPRAIANRTTRLTEFDDSFDIELVVPPSAEPLGDALCMGDELEPVAPEDLRLSPQDDANVMAEVLEHVESLLAHAGFSSPDDGRSRMNGLEPELNSQPVEEQVNKKRAESDDENDANDEDDEDEASADQDSLPVKMAPARANPPPAVTRQSPAPTITGNVIAGVSILSDNAERIIVGKNSSAAIDLTMDCDRAEIADPAVADIAVVSPRRVVVSGKSFGMTQMVLRVDSQQKVFNVLVEQDLSMLTNAIRSVSPTANVYPRSVNGTILLLGTVPDAQTGERIAEMASLFQGGPVRNQLSVAGVQQTLLRVVVAEVNKEAVRQLGFNWAIGGADWTRDFFFANNVGNLNPTVIGSNGLVDIAANPTPQMTYSIAPSANGPATNLTFGFPRAEFQVFMQALRQNSLARVLAEPNLVAISGQTATFLAGGEVPVPVTQGGATAGSITIEYKEFGIRLAFTPTVMAGQIVRLHVMSEVSDAIPGDTFAGGLPVFSFVTRRVESTVECGNGQTFAMAGLLNETIQAVARKLPGLGDLPVLGALFSSVEYQKNNTELVVLVTPQLVEPLDPQQIPPPPGSLMTEPNDFEFFGLSQLEGTPHEAPTFDRVPREIAPVNSPPVGSNGWVTTQVALRGPWGLADSDEN
ncbi:MAG TPA: pilus assembly protein N-terminal domain-containing protein [Phycisphaerae bacterium]|nr:pilus assembly protein N-terminal domain-containing protein [Phycisphaerae bacterium]